MYYFYEFHMDNTFWLSEHSILFKPNVNSWLSWNMHRHFGVSFINWNKSEVLWNQIVGWRQIKFLVFEFWFWMSESISEPERGTAHRVASRQFKLKPATLWVLRNIAGGWSNSVIEHFGFVKEKRKRKEGRGRKEDHYSLIFVVSDLERSSIVR